MTLSQEAQDYAYELLLESVKEDETDWFDFPGDYDGDDHPVHAGREALAFVSGGRYPRGSSHRFTHKEFLLFMERKCGHQVSTMDPFGFGNYCGERVQEPGITELTPESANCTEHAREERGEW